MQAALARAGIDATQATISRDLRAIGAVKGSNGYTIPGEALPTSSASIAVLAQHVIAAEPAAGVVVLKTTPGGAQVVALELDRSPPLGVVGTVAGDDTVMVAVGPRADIGAVCAEIRIRVGLPDSAGGDA